MRWWELALLWFHHSYKFPREHHRILYLQKDTGELQHSRPRVLSLPLKARIWYSCRIPHVKFDTWYHLSDDSMIDHLQVCGYREHWEMRNMPRFLLLRPKLHRRSKLQLGLHQNPRQLGGIHYNTIWISLCLRHNPNHLMDHRICE